MGQDDEPYFNENPTPEEMATELQGDMGPWSFDVCASEIGKAKTAGDTEKLRYWLEVARRIAEICLQDLDRE